MSARLSRSKIVSDLTRFLCLGLRLELGSVRLLKQDLDQQAPAPAPAFSRSTPADTSRRETGMSGTVKDVRLISI
jgi:hypothetical protein